MGYVLQMADSHPGLGSDILLSSRLVPPFYRTDDLKNDIPIELWFYRTSRLVET